MYKILPLLLILTGCMSEAEIEARQSEMCAEYGRTNDVYTHWNWNDNICEYDTRLNWRGEKHEP